MISEELLVSYNAEKIFVKRRDTLFTINSKAKFYYQVALGEIKMNNFNDDGKEFIQGIFKPGSSFGEPPLFSERNYPAHAEAVTDSYVWKLKKEAFFELLVANPDVHLQVTQTLANRLHYKAMMVAEISSENAEHRLLRLMDYFKKHIHKLNPDEIYKVELSRQQMADLTGLRVETVIRSIKSLQKKGAIKLEHHKILR
ncbi:Crp/Fnr family transcriptional regulator [Spongiimicrobium sp. 3-5]|uniref:Crp/Fnr family transcriptional regulator n=1 Tax=Spongiimicrobium sp. 3-5 TaxID=3332596 RepID=UPI0039803AA0